MVHDRINHERSQSLFVSLCLSLSLFLSLSLSLSLSLTLSLTLSLLHTYLGTWPDMSALVDLEELQISSSRFRTT